MSKPKVPAGLADGGRALWRDIVKDHDLDAVQVVTLTEACRLKDRLDDMDEIIQGKGVLELLRFRRMDQGGCGHDDEPVTIQVKFDDVISRANATANQMKQMLAALRLADVETGARPQQRGGARGAYKPGGKAGTVSSLDRARAAKSN